MDARQHRELAVEANNATWELLGLTERTASQTEEMLRRAYAAAYHWDRAEPRGPENLARADWLLARAHRLAGLPERSLHYAERCLAACTEDGLVDFDLAYAHEAMARALKALGHDDAAQVHWTTAMSVPVADEEDRALVEADLAEGP